MRTPTMMTKKIFPLAGLVVLLYFLSSRDLGIMGRPVPGRIVENINAGWRYLPDNTKEVADLAEATDWQELDLPHTWNQWDALDMVPGYRRDASWYQKTIFVKHYANARYVLYFEGANISTQVYVNDKLAGTHVGGYVGFDIDITEHLRRGQENTISIRVDNSYEPNVIPSQKADFFIYGGIVRDLWLKILPERHLATVHIRTPQVSAERALAEVAITLNEPLDEPERWRIRCQLMESATGKVVATQSSSLEAPGTAITVRLPELTAPRLWSPDDPQRYELRTQLLRDDGLLDERTEVFGFRWFEFGPQGDFFLNGERLLLRGTHRHEEHAGYGAAMPNELHWQDMAMIKEMGANFVRLGHYPQDPEVYRACDELGLIVWDELPWCRGGMGGTVWQANTERLLREQISQNYNHPSVFFWSVGNEIYWLPDFAGGDNEDQLNAYVSKLHRLAHELDPSRLTAIRKYYAGADLVDVFSPSIWSGWYAGVYTNYQQTLTKNQATYPRFLHMEYGGSSHIGRHTETPITGDGTFNEDDWAEVANQVNITNIAKSGDWTENYIVDLFDHYLSVSETQPHFAGNAQWAFKDFGTPLRPENAIPYLNQKGLVDRAGNPKDAFYVYKSYWSKDPFAYIESHTWTVRRGPADKPRNVAVYSNCEQVQLIHNGRALPKKSRSLGELPACGLNWDILFKEGPNELIALAYQDDKRVATDTLIVNYSYEKAGSPDRISLNASRLPNGNYLIEAILVDEQGLRILDYEKHLYFTRDGQGELVKDYGTPTRSQVIQMANGRAAIELVPAASGKAIIEARNQDFKGSYLIIDFDRQTESTNGIETRVIK